jgi:hypothetical protein
MSDGMMEAARSQRAYREERDGESYRSRGYADAVAYAWEWGYTTKEIKANYPSAKRLPRAKMYLVEVEAGSAYLFVPLERPADVGPTGAARYRLVTVS